MLQERKGFFYEPELLDYKPVYARPDMNIMLKIIEAGAEKVAHQQDMLNKVEDSVRKTPAYLDQDIKYVGDVTSQIDTEISGMMDGTVDLLDPANTGKVMQIAKKYMYDPELAKITSRTGKISKSQEQIEAMRKAGKISAENYWEFNQSILNANNEFANSKKYNPDVNLHYDIVPYTDERAEKLETLSKIPLHTTTVPIRSADGRWMSERTIKAVNPQMSANIQYAKNDDERNKWIAENDRQLTALFLANMSEGARQQLIAQAKMNGAKTEADYQLYIQKSVLGVVDMANDADIIENNVKADPYTLAAEDRAFQLKMWKMKDAADKEAARVKFERDKKLKEMEKDEEAVTPENRNIAGTSNIFLPSTPYLGMKPGTVSPYTIRTKITEVAGTIQAYSTNVQTINDKVKADLNAAVQKLIAEKGFPKSTAFTLRIEEDKKNPGRYTLVNTIPDLVLRTFPEFRHVVENAAGVLNHTIAEGSKLGGQKAKLKQIQTEIETVTKNPNSAKEYDETVKNADMFIDSYLYDRFRVTQTSPNLEIYSDKINDFIAKFTGGKASTIEDWKALVVNEAVTKSKNPELQSIHKALDDNFNKPKNLEAVIYYANPEAGTKSTLTPVAYRNIQNDILKQVVTDSNAKIIDANGKVINSPTDKKEIAEAIITTTGKSDDEENIRSNYGVTYLKENGKWYMQVNVVGKKVGTYLVQLSDVYAKSWIQKLNFEHADSYDVTNQVVAQASLYGTAVIPGTDAIYDPNPTTIFNDGIPQAELSIAGESIPYSVDLRDPITIQEFYRAVNSNIGNASISEATRKEAYRDGLKSIGFGDSQIDNIFSNNQSWFK